MGKMIDAQSIVVAGVATGQQGGERNPRYVFFHSLALAIIVGVIVCLQATIPFARREGVSGFPEEMEAQFSCSLHTPFFCMF